MLGKGLLSECVSSFILKDGKPCTVRSVPFSFQTGFKRKYQTLSLQSTLNTPQRQEENINNMKICLEKQILNIALTKVFRFDRTAITMTTEGQK